MKYLFLISMVVLSFVANAQSNVSEINNALKSGDVAALATHFDSQVEIGIDGRDKTYSKADAKAALDNFFKNNKPKYFNQVHSGSSKGADSKYFIAEMKTTTAEYRVYVHLRVVDDEALIQEIRFEEDF